MSILLFKFYAIYGNRKLKVKLTQNINRTFLNSLQNFIPYHPDRPKIKPLYFALYHPHRLNIKSFYFQFVNFKSQFGTSKYATTICIIIIAYISSCSSSCSSLSTGHLHLLDCSISIPDELHPASPSLLVFAFSRFHNTIRSFSSVAETLGKYRKN